MEIRAANGQLIYVELYGSSSGSFHDFSVSQDTSTAQRKYYHSGNLHKLDDILRRALAEAKKPL